MAGVTGYGVYRVLKARIDFGHGGEGGKVFAYALYDGRDVKLFHCRSVEGEGDSPHGIKSSWKDFTSFIDGAFGQPMRPDIATMVSDLAQVLQEVGVFDLKEDNLTKLRYMEKVFSNRAAQIYDGQCVAFLKIEGLTSMEAGELMEKFPKQKVESEDSEGGQEVDLPLPDGMRQKKVLPKLVFSCSTVLDPVKGVPASDVRPGDLVTVSIPEDSPLYGTMKAQSDQEGRVFDGKVDLILTSVSESDTDRLVLEFDLTDGVLAVAMAQKTLRIKALVAGSGEEKRFLALSPVQFAVVGASFFLLAIILLFVLKR